MDIGSRIRSSPLVSEELLYFGSDDGVIHALDLSGEARWRFVSKRAVISSPALAEGLVVVDNNGKIVMMNPAAEKLLETRQKEKVGKHLSEDMKDDQLLSLIKETPNKESNEIELISQQDETKKI